MSKYEVFSGPYFRINDVGGVLINEERGAKWLENTAYCKIKQAEVSELTGGTVAH